MSKGRAELLRIETRHVGLEEFCFTNELMQASPLLTRLNADQRHRLLAGGEVVGYRRGEEILPPGSSAARMGLVLTGTVSLLSSPCCELMVLGGGEIIGLDSVLPLAPKLGAVAGEDVRLAWLEAAAVVEMGRESPELDDYLRQRAQHLLELSRDSDDFFSRW